MIYTDGQHLTADSLHELYRYANEIGLNPGWIDFMGRNIHPHFDICGRVKVRVLADVRVQKVSCKELVRLCIKNFRVPNTDKNAPNLEMPTEAEYERMIDNIFRRAGIIRDNKTHL
jgi:hypothetical protein